MGKQKAWASAIISGVIAFLTSLSTAFQGQNPGLTTITVGQWITAVLALVVAFAGAGGLTYKIANSDTGERAPDRPVPSMARDT